MVAATRIRQNGVLLKLNSATPPAPPNYAAPCAFTERSVRWEKTTAETDVPDCGDPGLPGWVAVDIISRLLRISGGGILSTEAVATWLDAWDTDDELLALVEITASPGVDYTYSGVLIVTSVEMIGNRGDGTAQIRVEAVSNGRWTRIDS